MAGKIQCNLNRSQQVLTLFKADQCVISPCNINKIIFMHAVIRIAELIM